MLKVVPVGFSGRSEMGVREGMNEWLEEWNVHWPRQRTGGRSRLGVESVKVKMPIGCPVCEVVRCLCESGERVAADINMR